MSTEIIIALVGVLSTVVSSFVTFLVTKKKYYAEVDGNLIQNMRDSLAFYQKLSDDNKERLEQALQRSQQLEDEVRELRSQVTQLTISICTDLSCQLRKRNIENARPLRNRPDEAAKKAQPRGEKGHTAQ